MSAHRFWCTLTTLKVSSGSCGTSSICSAVRCCTRSCGTSFAPSCTTAMISSMTGGTGMSPSEPFRLTPTPRFRKRPQPREHLRQPQECSTPLPSSSLEFPHCAGTDTVGTSSHHRRGKTSQEQPMKTHKMDASEPFQLTPTPGSPGARAVSQNGFSLSPFSRPLSLAIAATQAERPAKRRNSNTSAPGNKDDLGRQLLFINTRLGLRNARDAPREHLLLQREVSQ